MDKMIKIREEHNDDFEGTAEVLVTFTDLVSIEDTEFRHNVLVPCVYAIAQFEAEDCLICCCFESDETWYLTPKNQAIKAFAHAKFPDLLTLTQTFAQYLCQD